MARKKRKVQSTPNLVNDAQAPLDVMEFDEAFDDPEIEDVNPLSASIQEIAEQLEEEELEKSGVVDPEEYNKICYLINDTVKHMFIASHIAQESFYNSANQPVIHFFVCRSTEKMFLLKNHPHVHGVFPYADIISNEKKFSDYDRVIMFEGFNSSITDRKCRYETLDADSIVTEYGGFYLTIKDFRQPIKMNSVVLAGSTHDKTMCSKLWDFTQIYINSHPLENIVIVSLKGEHQFSKFTNSKITMINNVSIQDALVICKMASEVYTNDHTDLQWINHGVNLYENELPSGMN